MKGSSPRVPQQDNFSDCGVYILQYVESFFEVRRLTFNLSLSCRFKHRPTLKLKEPFSSWCVSLQTESDSQFPPAGQPVRLVPSAANEDEAWGDQGAYPEDPGAARTGKEGARPGRGSTRLSWRARDRRDFWVDGAAAKTSHQPLKQPHLPPPTPPPRRHSRAQRGWGVEPDCTLLVSLQHVWNDPELPPLTTDMRHTFKFVWNKTWPVNMLEFLRCLCNLLFYDSVIKWPVKLCFHRCSSLQEDLCRYCCALASLFFMLSSCVEEDRWY